MKKIAIIAWIVVLFLPAGTLSYAQTYKARVENISNRKYFERTLFCLQKAEKSILAAMYIITLDKDSENSETKQLLSALVSANKRGIDVKVIIEYHSGLDLTPRGMRNNAYNYLMENGVPVYFDESAHRCAHLKTIVIDNKIVITGSANWSLTAFRTNDETNVLIYSRPLAEEIAKEILSIPLSLPLAAEGSFNIQPLFFSEKEKLIGKIVSSKDERVLDILLLLLYNGAPTIDFDFIARHLRLTETMNRTGYRRQIIKVLKKIEQKYKFAEFNIAYGRNEIKTQFCGVSAGQSVLFPRLYFNGNWHKILSLPGKAVLITFYAEVSGMENKDIEACISYLAKKYGIAADTFSSGLQELKHYNIVKVYYTKGFKERDPLKISLVGLYDLVHFKNALDEMYKKYGKKNTEYARHFANIVYCAYDLNVIGDILEQINRYGHAACRRAFDITARKSPDNPQKTYIYTRGIIRKLGEKSTKNQTRK